MNATRQDFDPSGGKKRYSGIVWVVLLHLLILWGLASGLARKAVEVIKKPIEMKIMEEIKLPPPPPPPPPPKVLKPLDTPPPVQAPPPPFVPPAEVQPRVAPTAPVIQATQAEAPKAPVEIRPAVALAPPAPAPARAERVEVGVACPGYKETLQSALSGVYDKVGIAATVRVQFKVREGKVTDVSTNGPREYQRPVQNAVRRFNCSATTADEASVSFDVAFVEE